MRRTLVAAVMAVALLAAGCGDKKGDYIRAVNDAQVKYGARVLANPDNRQQAAAINAFAGKLASLKTPNKHAKAAQANLVRVVRQAAAAVAHGADLDLTEQRVKAALGDLDRSL